MKQTIRDILFVNKFLADCGIEPLRTPYYGTPYSSFSTDWAGVYLIWNESTLVYIGQSEDVTWRLYQHRVLRINIDEMYDNPTCKIMPGHKLAAVPISDPTIRLSVEGALIALLNPLNNKQWNSDRSR